MKIDYEYICKIMSNLSTLPIRLYKNHKKVFYFTPSNYSHDPADIIEGLLFNSHNSIDYFFLEDLSYYGIVNSKDVQIVLGPSRNSPYTEKDAKELALKLQLPISEYQEFTKFMTGIMPMPIESTLQTLCTLNYILNEEKKTLDDFFPDALPSQPIVTATPLQPSVQESHFNNTYMIEQSLLDIVRTGNVEKLKSWAKTAPAANGGLLSQNALRHQKNTFIVTATIVSRAAIEGGMEINEALALSDYYIQKEELTNDNNAISYLQFQMVMDYTAKVSALANSNHHQSKFVRKVKSYVHDNITEPIKTEDIAKELKIERSTLSKRFKSETSENLSDYILRKKIEKSKLLIKEGYSLISISTYLSFSSQSHFTKLFTKYVGVSPSQYKKNHQ